VKPAAAERKEGTAMENVEIARVLNEYTDLLDIQGENPFRVRSYCNAAQTVAGLSQPVAQLIEAEEDLRKLPGIGSSMAAHLKEILETGTLSGLEEVRRALPPTLTELVQLQHLGPKRARQLYDALGITSVSELAAAINTGKVEALPGFGKKSAGNLRRALEEFERRTKRFLLADADQLVQPLLRYLRQAPGIIELEVAGSYRPGRRRWATSTSWRPVRTPNPSCSTSSRTGTLSAWRWRVRRAARSSYGRG